jgi:hypothetical protein
MLFILIHVTNNKKKFVFFDAFCEHLASKFAQSGNKTKNYEKLIMKKPQFCAEFESVKKIPESFNTQSYQHKVEESYNSVCKFLDNSTFACVSQ